MARSLRLTGIEQQDFIEQASRVIDNLPPVSTFSTADGPEDSNLTAGRGTLGIELGSGVTTLWVKISDGTLGWTAVV